MPSADAVGLGSRADVFVVGSGAVVHLVAGVVLVLVPTGVVVVELTRLGVRIDSGESHDDGQDAEPDEGDQYAHGRAGSPLRSRSCFGSQLSSQKRNGSNANCAVSGYNLLVNRMVVNVCRAGYTV